MARQMTGNEDLGEIVIHDVPEKLRKELTYISKYKFARSRNSFLKTKIMELRNHFLTQETEPAENPKEIVVQGLPREVLKDLTVISKKMFGMSRNSLLKKQLIEIRNHFLPNGIPDDEL